MTVSALWATVFEIVPYNGEEFLKIIVSFSAVMEQQVFWDLGFAEPSLRLRLKFGFRVEGIGSSSRTSI